MISCRYAAGMRTVERCLLGLLLVCSVSGLLLPGYARSAPQTPSENDRAPSATVSGEQATTVTDNALDTDLEGPPRPFHPNPCGHLSGEAGWVDRTHDWMSRTVCGPTRWVDGFFIGPNEIDTEQLGTQLRIIGASRWQDNDDDGSEVKVRARAELPNAQERLSLLFQTDDDVDDERCS